MKLKNLVLCVISTTAAIALPASATIVSTGVISMADLALTKLVLNKVGTGSPVPAAAFTTGAALRTVSDSVSFNDTWTLEELSGGDSKQSSTGGAIVDPAAACQGSTCNSLPSSLFTNNATTHLTDTSGNFSLSDAYMSGSVWTAAPAGIISLTRADTAATAFNKSADASGTITSSSKVTIKTNQTVNVSFAATFDAYLKSFMAASTSGNTSAEINWTLTLKAIDDSTFTTLEWQPAQVNKEFGASGPTNKSYIYTGTLTSGERTLTAGKIYTLAISQGSTASANVVPEPGSIALLGLGLFALAGLSRRRNAN